jgi:hypothetical protein
MAVLRLTGLYMLFCPAGQTWAGRRIGLRFCNGLVENLVLRTCPPGGLKPLGGRGSKSAGRPLLQVFAALEPSPRYR